MGEVEANRDMVARHDLCHDRHTVSLNRPFSIFAEVSREGIARAELAEEIIRETCKELDNKKKSKSFYIPKIKG